MTELHHTGRSPFASGVDQRQSKNYRADIDGLRAVAVLTIVAFHLGVRIVGGGYVGVDIFFVISGYLIGGNVLKQIQNKNYSIVDFYVRRFRRIIPSLTLLFLVVALLVVLFFLPRATASFGGSLISAALFGSNIFFFMSSGYFAEDASAFPLLHTWSLAVEEQYYIIFPWLMIAMRRFSTAARNASIVIIALLSLALSIVCITDFPDFTFYLLPTRLWELLLGAIIFLWPIKAFDRSRWRELASWIGAILVLAPVFLYSAATPFPGLAALPPCLGTAILLSAGARGSSSVYKILALRPVVFFGLISYSLYLWHWPVIVFIEQIFSLAWLPPVTKGAAFLLATGLAWVSWRIVERPFRNPAISGKRILAGTAASILVFCGIGYALVETGGLPGRFDAKTLRLASADGQKTGAFRDGQCFIDSASTFSSFDYGNCLKRASNRPNILLMGDSHAAHLWVGLQKEYPGVNFLQATVAACPLTLDSQAVKYASCAKLAGFLYKAYLVHKPVDLILLSGNWYSADVPRVVATLDWLHARGYKVILSGPIVRYYRSLPELLALGAARRDATLVERSRQPDLAALDETYRALAAQHHALYFSPYRALCPAARCRVTDSNGMAIQFDYSHLTTPGSVFVAKTFPMARVLAWQHSAPLDDGGQVAGIPSGASGQRMVGTGSAATSDH